MVSVIKVKTIEEIKEIKNTEKSLSIVISRHDLNETQIKELSEILLNTSNAPIYQFKMEHIYRDRVLKTKAEKVLEEKMKEVFPSINGLILTEHLREQKYKYSDYFHPSMV